MSAPASTLPKRKPAAKRKSRKKQSPGWIAWWPLVLGIIVTPFAVKSATLMALTGPDGLRLLYPWMLIPKLHLFGLSDSVSDPISQAMMYLQFPLYGLFAMMIHRWKGAMAAILQVSLLHLLSVGLLFLISRA
jgi:glucose uptake protein GlcU